MGGEVVGGVGAWVRWRLGFVSFAAFDNESLFNSMDDCLACLAGDIMSVFLPMFILQLPQSKSYFRD